MVFLFVEFLPSEDNKIRLLTIIREVIDRYAKNGKIKNITTILGQMVSIWRFDPNFVIYINNITNSIASTYSKDSNFHSLSRDAQKALLGEVKEVSFFEIIYKSLHLPPRNLCEIGTEDKSTSLSEKSDFTPLKVAVAFGKHSHKETRNMFFEPKNKVTKYPHLTESTDVPSLK